MEANGLVIGAVFYAAIIAGMIWTSHRVPKASRWAGRLVCIGMALVFWAFVLWAGMAISSYYLSGRNCGKGVVARYERAR